MKGYERSLVTYAIHDKGPKKCVEIYIVENFVNPEILCTFLAYIILRELNR